MRLRAVSTVAAVGAGLALAATLLTSRPARAQFTGPAQTLPPLTGSVGAGSVASAPAPQPIQIQALDSSHFVVATREPRLVQRATGGDGPATNMLVTVVTYYTVAGNRLIPVEHVRTPAGWQPVALAGE